MALSDRWIPLRLQLGVDTETDEKCLVPGQPTSLENAVFTKRVTIEKRYGTRNLSKRRIGAVYSKVSGCLGLVSRDDGNDLVMLASSDEVLSYDDGADCWIPRGTWTPMQHSAKDLPHGATERWDATTASTGSVRLVAWEDARGGVYAQLFNSTTSVPYGREFRIAGSQTRSPRALNVGGQLLVFMVSGTSPNSLHVGRINAADPSAGSVTMTQLHSSLWSQAPYYDAASIGTNGNSALIVVSQSGSLYAAVISSNGAIESSASLPQGPNPTSGTYGTAITPALAVSSDGLSALVAYKTFAPLSGVEAWTISVPSLATLSSRVTADVNPLTVGYGSVNQLAAVFVTASAGIYQYQIVSEISASDAADRYLRSAAVSTSTTALFTSGNLIRHSSLSSTPFLLGGRPYVWTTHVSPLQSTDFLVRVDDGVTVARSRYAQCISDVSGVLGNVDVVGTKAYRVGTSRNILELPNTPISASAFSDRQLSLLSTEYHPSASCRPVDVDGVLYVPGGMPGMYDGVQVVEHGFTLKAEAGTSTVSSGSTGQGSDPFACAGTASFVWATVPEWYDARGNRHLGGFVSFMTGTMSGSAAALHSQNQSTLSIRTIAHTLKDGTHAQDLNWRVYRSGPNGTLLQYVGSVVNQTGSDRVTFTDTVPDTNRVLGEPIYAVNGGGGETQNAMIASPSSYAVAGDRLWAAGLEGDPYFVAASKLRFGGAIAFADGGVSVDAAGGPITALAALDEYVVAFKRARLYAFNADGPENIAGDTKPWPLGNGLVTSDVGAPAPATIAMAAGTNVQGLVFKSERGIRLIDRTLSVQDIGGPVRGYDSLSVVGGTTPESANQLRLYTSDGRTLVLDTRFDQWSTFPGQPAVAACTWRGIPTFASERGDVWVEDSGSYLDGGTPYVMAIELGWLPLSDSIQGLAKVRDVTMLGTYYSPHDLRLRMAFDYRDTWAYTRQIDTTASLNIVEYGGGASGSSGAVGYGSGSFGGRDPVYQFRFNVPQSSAQALKLRIEDVSPEGRSFDLTEMKVRVAVASAKARLPARKVR